MISLHLAFQIFLISFSCTTDLFLSLFSLTFFVLFSACYFHSWLWARALGCKCSAGWSHIRGKGINHPHRMTPAQMRDGTGGGVSDSRGCVVFSPRITRYLKDHTGPGDQSIKTVSPCFTKTRVTAYSFQRDVHDHFDHRLPTPLFTFCFSR